MAKKKATKKKAAKKKTKRSTKKKATKKKSAKKSSEEWLSVKTNFLYLGGYFACVHLAYEVCSRLR